MVIWVKLAGALWIIGGKIRQLINILFCGYRLTRIRDKCMPNLYSPGTGAPASNYECLKSEKLRFDTRKKL
jgi:hypothetical protein